MGVFREKHGELAGPDGEGSFFRVVVMLRILLFLEGFERFFQRGALLPGKAFVP